MRWRDTVVFSSNLKGKIMTMMRIITSKEMTAGPTLSQKKNVGLALLSISPLEIFKITVSMAARGGRTTLRIASIYIFSIRQCSCRKTSCRGNFICKSILKIIDD